MVIAFGSDAIVRFSGQIVTFTEGPTGDSRGPITFGSDTIRRFSGQIVYFS